MHRLLEMSGGHGGVGKSRRGGDGALLRGMGDVREERLEGRVVDGLCALCHQRQSSLLRRMTSRVLTRNAGSWSQRMKTDLKAKYQPK